MTEENVIEENIKVNRQIYKKYFKAANNEGFLTLRPWFEAKKIQIEIGAVENGALKTVSTAWPNAIDLATYLHAVANNSATQLYPADPRMKIENPETWVSYGGGDTPTGTVARKAMIEWWDKTQGEAFVWRNTSWEGKRLAGGAVVPLNDKPLTKNMIKVTRQEMAIISYSVDLALNAFVSQVGEMWWTTNG